MEKIIEQLKDDKNYYGELGKKYLSNSDIYDLINNPNDFQKPKEQSVAFEYGQAFHEMLMFGTKPQFISCSSRRTNIYKEALAEKNLDMMLLESEAEQLINEVNKAKDNEFVAEVLNNPDVQFEVPNVAVLTDSNIEWKCKADIVTNDWLYDIKTTSNLKGFRHSFFTYNYDSQAFIYSKMFQKPMRFIVIEKKTGCIGLFDVSDNSYTKGQEKVEQAEDNYKKYFLEKTDKLKDFMKYEEI